MSDGDQIGCFRAIGIAIVLLAAAMIVNFFFHQLARILSIFPGWVWMILIIAGIVLYQKLSAKD